LSFPLSPELHEVNAPAARNAAAAIAATFTTE
jgi:hypothetical protein